MRRLIYAVLLTAVLASPALAGKRVALVIGNSNYQNVTALTNPANDAAVMEQALKGAGFDVIKYTDLDQRGMKQAMLEFGRKLKQGADASMFFYAGHGIEVDGRNYLVPVDSNTESKEEADIQNVEVNDFLALMENSGVPLNIVVLDACRNNPFRGLRSIGGGLAPVRAPVGTFVAYSTAPGSVAADGTGNNSPFTIALAETMKVPGLALETVFKQTRSKVRVATGGAQVPFDSSAIEGEFYFNEAPAVSAPQTIVSAPVVEQPVAEAPVVDAPVVEAPPVLTRSEKTEAEDAFNAAGSDAEQLRVVSEQYGDTIWGKLAGAKLRVIDQQYALANPKTPTVAPEVVTPPPAAAVIPGLHVAADGSGDYTSIADAVAAANDGDKIIIAPGEYSGGVVVKKSIDIVGPDDPKQAVWSNAGDHVINWQASGGRIANITIHQTGGCQLNCSAIYFLGGTARVENNFLSSDGGTGIYITGPAARPDVVHNTISTSKETGVLLEMQAAGSIDGNDIFDNGLAGIEFKSGADPVIKNNVIRDGRSAGILVGEGGLGTIEFNDVTGNALAGIETGTKGKIIVRSNKINNNKQAGVFLQSSGQGLFENNEIKGNTFSGVELSSGGSSIFKNNTVSNNVEYGFYIHNKASATITNNIVSGNGKAGFLIEKDAGKVKRSGNKE
jgi:parallel beta-helix repeat protein